MVIESQTMAFALGSHHANDGSNAVCQALRSDAIGARIPDPPMMLVFT